MERSRAVSSRWSWGAGGQWFLVVLRSLFVVCAAGNCADRPCPGPGPGESPCCASGFTACGADCVDLQTSLRHCGACGRACAAGQRCANGACACESGLTWCGADGCVNTRDSADHCGVCGHACGAGASCFDQSCVCGGGVRCGERCVNVDGDASNCGGCGRACGVGRTCQEGRCVAPCPAGRAACAVGAPTSCNVDTSSSAEHCGGCFQVCRRNEACVDAQCRCADPSGCGPTPYAPRASAPCSGSDVETRCAEVPGATVECIAGACAYRCRADLARCDDAAPDGCGVRLDTITDCGACGVRCAPGQRCGLGVCACAPGRVLCGERCVSLRGDATHCGACGVACAAGEDCAAGRCAPRAAPRLLAPPSGAVLAGRRPRFRWLPARGDVGARVEVCRDRACTTPVAALDAVGSSLPVGVDLPTGVLFWRVRGIGADGVARAMSATWPFRLGERGVVPAQVTGHFVDVNGDGFADLVERERSSGRVCVYLGAADGLRRGTCRAFIDAWTGFPEAPDAIAFGDFDADGFTDVALRQNGLGPSPVFLLRGGASGLSLADDFWDFSSPWTPPPPSAGLYGVGDIDDDGYADLAAYATLGSNEVIAIHGGGPAGGPWLPSLLLPRPDKGAILGVRAPGSTVIYAGDLNGDGYGDLIAEPRRDFGSRPVAIHFGGATGPGDPALFTLRSVRGPRGVTLAGDFDGDGFGDFAIVDGGGVWERHGGAMGFTLGSRPPLERIDDAAWATSFDGARDFNGDGRADAVALQRNLSLRFFFGSDSGLSAVGTAVPVDVRLDLDREPVLRWLGDVNRDGFDDLLLSTRPELQIYLGTANGLPMDPSQRLPRALSE